MFLHILGTTGAVTKFLFFKHKKKTSSHLATFPHFLLNCTIKRGLQLMSYKQQTSKPLGLKYNNRRIAAPRLRKLVTLTEERTSSAVWPTARERAVLKTFSHRAIIQWNTTELITYFCNEQ